MTFARLWHLFRQIDAWLIVPALMLVIWGELSRSPWGERLEAAVWDKALHFTAYFGLSLMATIAVQGRRRALWCAMGLIALGGSLEVIQGFVGRDCDIWDEVANTIGVLSGLLLALLGISVLRLAKLVELTPPD